MIASGVQPRPPDVEDEPQEDRRVEYRARLKQFKSCPNASLRLLLSSLADGREEDVLAFCRALGDGLVDEGSTTALLAPLLLLAVQRGMREVVYALRSSQAPVTAAIMFKMAECDCSEHDKIRMLAALQMTKEYCALASEPNDKGDTVMHIMGRRRHWLLIRHMLREFEAVDGEMRSGFDEMTLKDMCQSAPSTVRDEVDRASRLHEYRARIQAGRVGRRNVIHPDLSGGRERFPVRVVNEVDKTRLDDFIYATRVVDPSRILARRSDQNDYTPHCACTGLCEVSCKCSHGNRNYSHEGNVHMDRLNSSVRECSSVCECSLHCGNRVAQKGAMHPVEVFRSPDARGWAVRALRTISRGAFICEYTGELLDERVADSRPDAYLFETVMGDDRYTIDARVFGNFGRFINHSCEPNCKVGMVIWDSWNPTFNHICIFAARSIQQGEELTIDYGVSWWEAKIREFPCLCLKQSCKYGPSQRERHLRELEQKEQEKGEEEQEQEQGEEEESETGSVQDDALCCRRESSEESACDTASSIGNDIQWMVTTPE